MSDSPIREPTQEQWMQIQAALFAGRKIQAIKAYREATGVGLKEAKDAMEAYEVRLRQEHPDRFTAAPKSGCMGVILLAVLAAAVAAYGWRVSSTFISRGLSVVEAPLIRSQPNATGAMPIQARSPQSHGFAPGLICPS